MIIFDLDGTLADCEHRRHFVDPKKSKTSKFIFDDLEDLGDCLNLYGNYYFIGSENKWQPAWDAFYKACDKDKPINQTINILRTLWIKEGEEIQIWSGRSESVKDKTLEWITSYIFGDYDLCELKMRPIGNTEPDEVLKERWLDESIADGKTIDFVFDDRPKVIRMWRRRGIFVFSCCQHDEEF